MGWVVKEWSRTPCMGGWVGWKGLRDGRDAFGAMLSSTNQIYGFTPCIWRSSLILYSTNSSLPQVSQFFQLFSCRYFSSAYAYHVCCLLHFPSFDRPDKPQWKAQVTKLFNRQFSWGSWYFFRLRSSRKFSKQHKNIHVYQFTRSVVFISTVHN